MEPFNYYNPTNIVFGVGQIGKLNQLIKKDAKVLILYGGGSVKKTGTLEEVKNALSTRSIFEFGGIEANPEYETLLQAVKMIKENNIDFLLAVGGGSVIDGVKFISAAVFHEDPWKMLLRGGDDLSKSLPFGSVLTLAATGSEMNAIAVISRHEKNAKLTLMNPLLFPKFSILDPSKTLTLPMKQVINGVVDSYIHILEQYATYPVNAPIQDRFSESLLKTLIEEGFKVIKNPEDLDVRANLMLNATLALNGLISVGVPQDWSTHAIGHVMTTLFGLDHAQTLAIVLPGVWEVMRDQKAKKLVQYVERVWGLSEGDDQYKIDQAIEKTEKFFNDLGMKTSLSDFDIDESGIDRIIELLDEYNHHSLGENGLIDLDKSRQILLTRL